MSLEYKRLTPSTDVLVQNTGDEMVLLDLNSEQYFGLDAIGARAWTLVSNHADTALVLQQLSSEYEVDEEQLVLDLNALFSELVLKKLLVGEKN